MPLPAHRTVYDFDEVLDTDEGWAKENRHYWLRDWRGFAEFFFGELFCEPHSTKLREDCRRLGDGDKPGDDAGA